MNKSNITNIFLTLFIEPCNIECLGLQSINDVEFKAMQGQPRAITYTLRSYWSDVYYKLYCTVHCTAVCLFYIFTFLHSYPTISGTKQSFFYINRVFQDLFYIRVRLGVAELEVGNHGCILVLLVRSLDNKRDLKGLCHKGFYSLKIFNQFCGGPAGENIIFIFNQTQKWLLIV